jgi:hypothetical protein
MSALLAGLLALPALANAQDRQRGYEPYAGDYDSASLRINFNPTDAEVYVDGYFAGRVSEFDGVFQRLHVAPGHHVVTIERPGFRAERYNVNLSRHGSRTITGRLERLRGGQMYGPPPAYAGGPERGDWDYGRTGRYTAPNSRPGIVSLRVMPGDAEIFVNGSRRSWQRRDDRYELDLEPGRHHIEIRRAGYAPYYRDIDVRAGATLSLKVTLRRGF